MKRIAVTGGAAVGKSTVMGFLADSGRAVASADAIAREVYHRPEVQAKIAEASGLLVPVDRSQLLRAMASNPVLRRAVNSAMHPAIAAALAESAAEFFEVPLLLESCLQGSFDRIWVVDCGPDEQLERLVQRLGDEAEARRLVAAQLPPAARVAFADVLIRTNQPPATVRDDISKILRG